MLFALVCALFFLSPLLSDSPRTPQPSPARPKPGSLAADWVVIVIKSSCTASEYTKLSANGWSSVGGWPGDWRGREGLIGGLGWGSLWSLSTLSQHIVYPVLFIIITVPCTREWTQNDNHCNTPAAFEDEK